MDTPPSHPWSGVALPWPSHSLYPRRLGYGCLELSTEAGHAGDRTTSPRGGTGSGNPPGPAAWSLTHTCLDSRAPPSLAALGRCLSQWRHLFPGKRA